MKLDDAIEQIDRSLIRAENKRELNAKMRFSNILHELRSKNLSATELLELERELDALFSIVDLDDPRNLKFQLNGFLNRLRKKLSIIPEGFCAGRGMVIGLITGTFFLAFLITYSDSVFKYYAPLGGIIAGMIIGSLYDLQAKKKGRTLLTKMY